MKKSRFYMAKYGSIIIWLSMNFYMISNLVVYLDFFEVFSFKGEVTQRCNLVLTIGYSLLYGVLLRSFEGLMVGHRRILDLSYGHFLASFLCNSILGVVAWVVAPITVGKTVLVTMMLIGFQCMGSLVWLWVVHRFYERYYFVKEALFIYGSRENLKEYHRMKSTIVRYFKVNQEVEFTVGKEQLLQYIENAGIIFLGDIPTQLRNELLKFCMQIQKECYCLPKISDVYIQNAKVRQLHDKLLLQFPEIGVLGGKRILKRVMDIVIALGMLLLMAPFMLLIALGIKLEDRGSILYRQERVTEGGRTFYMLKFRSMREDAEKNGITLAKKLDSRVTRIGHLIRNIHFDELPQLFNVLKGDMSIVGPRPERRQFIEEYEAVIPEFSERLKVKGGLTGYAQVYGKYNTEPEDKIKYDLYYIYNYSLWLDIKILLLTVRILFQPENTQGIDEEQTSAVKKNK